MPRREQVRSIFQPFKPSSWADDGLEFIQCVGGLHPEIDEVWNFGDHRITPKVHPFTHVYVGNFIRECFGTDYLAGNGHRVPMFVQKLINGRVEWIGVPSFLWNDGPPWANNMLCPSPRWVFGGTVENVYLESQPSGHYVCVDIPCRGTVPDHLAYLPLSPENVCATAHCVCDNIPWEHSLARDKSLLDYWHILRE